MATQVDICNLALQRMGAAKITAINEGTKNADHCSAFWDYILDEVLEDYSWNFAKKVRALDYTTGFKVYADSDEQTITGITKANPAVVSIASHTFETGQTVYINDVVGMTEVNDRVFEVTDSAAGTINLVDIDSAPFTTYVSGGICYRKETDPKYSSGYTYDLPADYLRALHLSDENYEFEILGTGDNRRLCATLKDVILIYTALESTTTNMLNRFISAMAWRLAAELSVPLGKKGAKQESMMNMYSYVLGKKTASDARSESKKLNDYDSWLAAGNFT